MKELFKKQLETAKPRTKEQLEKTGTSKYFTGEDVEVGDIPLFAVLVQDPVEKEGEITELPLKFIMINEKSIDLFEPDRTFNPDETIPRVRLKSEK